MAFQMLRRRDAAYARHNRFVSRSIEQARQKCRSPAGDLRKGLAGRAYRCFFVMSAGYTMRAASAERSGREFKGSRQRTCGLRLVPVHDACFREVVRRHLYIDTIARDDANEKLPHFAGEETEHFVSVLKLYSKLRVREGFCDDASLFYGFLFGHVVPFLCESG